MTQIINDIQYHDDSFAMTADAVRKMNPHAAGYPKESLVEAMRRDAERLATEGGLGYSSTRGYVVSLYSDENGVGAVASVSGYTAQLYANGRSMPIKHKFSGLTDHAIGLARDGKGTVEEATLRAAMRGAIAALCQNATHPADVEAAVTYLRNALQD